MASGSTGALRRGTIGVTAVLAVAAIAWAAYPLSGGRAGTQAALIVAAIGAFFSVLRLVLAAAPRVAVPFLASAGRRMVDQLVEVVGFVPWAEGMLVAALALEALHRARPWHTAVLGLALFGYLLAVHLAETRARPRVLRGQLPLIAAGLGLLALAIGSAALPGHPPAGVAALLVTAVTVVAAVIVVALIMPGTGRRPG